MHMAQSLAADKLGIHILVPLQVSCLKNMQGARGAGVMQWWMT
jgi:hypothetical protein